MAKGREFLKRPRWQALSQRISYEDKLRIFKVCGYEPHPGQELVHRSSARFKVVNCGRRWGKTEGVQTHELIVILVLGGWAFNVAADYDTATILFESVVRKISETSLNELIAEDPRMAKGHQRLVLKSGGVLWSKSLYDDRRLRGLGLDFVATDEAAMHKSRVAWDLALRPALSDRMGGGNFTSTPKGRNYFKEFHDFGNKDLLSAGEKDRYPDWESWTFPTATNPHYPKSELVIEREQKSQAEYLQEYEAVFLDDIGGVFRGYMEAALVECKAEGDYAIVADVADLKPARYAIGVDLAIHGDFTVIWVVEIFSGRTVYVERFNKVDWDGISTRIVAVSKRFGYAPVVMDATNNASFVDQVQPLMPWAECQGFVFTKQSKAHVINELALAVEKKEFWLPDGKTKLGRQILREFGAMQYVRNETTGNIKMEAPAGEHDDIPIAAALARYGAATGVTGIPLIPGRSSGEDENTGRPELAGTFTAAAAPKTTRGPRPKKRFNYR